jgi:hypothetical protein
MVIVTSGPEVEFWDADLQGPPYRRLRIDGPVNVQFCGPEQRFIATCSDHTVALFEKDLEAPRKTWRATRAFVTEATRFLLEHVDGTLRLYDTVATEPAGAPIAARERPQLAATARNGQFLAIRWLDGALQIFCESWPIGPLGRNSRNVVHLAFDEETQSFRAICIDGTVEYWPLPKPVQGDPRNVTRLIESKTGMELTPQGETRLLSSAEWRQRQAD